MPGIRVGALYSPASSVVRVRATPLSLSMIVTVAPDMTPPLWSETIPRMRPKLACENNETVNSNTPRAAPSTETTFLARAFFDVKKSITPPLKARKSVQPQGRAHHDARIIHPTTKQSTRIVHPFVCPSHVKSPGRIGT